MKKISLVYRRDAKGWVKDYANNLSSKIESTEKIGFRTPKTPLLSNTLSTSCYMPHQIKKSNNKDIVHFLSNAYASTPRKIDFKDKKIVYTVQDLFPFYEEGLTASLFSKMHHRNIKNADRLIAVSEFTKQDIVERIGFEEEKIDVIPISIDTTHYREVKSKELDLPENYLLYVGGGFDRKNLEFLIEVHAKVAEKYENLHLVLTGPIGDQKQAELERKASNLGSIDLVVFTDWIKEEDMPELYSRAKIYVQPSKREGQGIPPIEAMACGTPPVVSDRTALPKTVEKSDLTVPLTVENFRKKIRKLLENQQFYQEMSKYGMERSRHFSEEKSIERHSKVYRKLIQEENNEFS